MPTDADFLAAVAASPHDRLPRLVYADWLDERGDLRGELIRLEEETRERVAWDDTLWRLKPRRNELRRQTDADWLKAMDYGQSCEPLFRGQPFPTDVRDAWRLIREAHERWTGEPMPDVGGHQDKVAEAEKRLGLTLPPSVREYVGYVHDLNRGSGKDWLRVYRDPYTMEPVADGHPALSLVEQSEGDLHWAVRFEELHHPDPPVYTYALDYEGGGDTFAPAPTSPCSTVTEFMLLYMWAYSHGHGGFGTSVTGVTALREDLTAWATHHGSVAQADPFTWDTGGMTVEFFETTNMTIKLRHGGVDERVDVKVWRPPPLGYQPPPFLRRLLRTGGWYRGVCDQWREAAAGE